MKKYFITGLIILLPVALTFVILLFIFNLLTEPFAGIVQSFMNKYNFFPNGFLFFTPAQVKEFVSQVLILVVLFLFTVGLGIVTSWFFFHYMIRFWEAIIHRIPFVRSVYKTCQEVIQTIFASKTNSFKQVVMAPFPNPQTYSFGLVTSEDVGKLTKDPLVAVFVPTTPNPTSGFLMLYKREDLIFLDMKVEDAFKYIISCGVIASPFSVITPPPVQKRLPKDLNL